jgi:hypothetical protein
MIQQKEALQFVSENKFGRFKNPSKYIRIEGGSPFNVDMLVLGRSSFG